MQRFNYFAAFAMTFMAGLNTPLNCSWGQDTKAIEAGKQIFEKQWKAEQPAVVGGDGLGPVHNEVSCVACHHLGGVGGAGQLEKNVDLLCLLPAESSRGPSPIRTVNVLRDNRIRKQLASVHPGFVDDQGSLNSTIVLHRFALDPRYAPSRERLVNFEVPHNLDVREERELQLRWSLTPFQILTPLPGIKLGRVQRNTPALFGAGVIDAIPTSLIQALEESQPHRFPGITGRAAPVGTDVGRFGWRGQTARLRDFVFDACANEVGLQVPEHDQAMDPLNPNYKAPGLDLDAQQCESLIAFIASLPAPTRRMPSHADSVVLVERGEKMLKEIGCVACHVEDLGPAKGIYSDLLLHDMGPSLADPAAANASLAVVLDRDVRVTKTGKGLSRLPSTKSSDIAVPQSGGGGGSYGGGPSVTTVPVQTVVSRSNPTSETTVTTSQTGVVVPTNVAQEWRTPPLWGVRDSAPYMHDGRAANLVEAIAYHGGEAKPSATAFFAMPHADRMAVVEFLRTLTAR